MYDVYDATGVVVLHTASRAAALTYARGVSIFQGHSDVWQWERVGTPTVGMRRVAFFRRGWRTA